MAYIVNDDIVKRVGQQTAGQLTSESGTAVDAAVLDECRLFAEGTVNSYVSKRYKVPVDLTAHPDVDATLSGYTLDLAVYRLHARKAPANKDVQKLYDDAIAWLTLVKDGEVNLPAALAPAPTTSEGTTVAYGSKEQNAATMRDF